jgi:hypothetical protein
MKKNLLIALAVCLATVAGLSAQPYHMIKVNVPYNIVVGNTTLPAGEFLISDTNNGGSSSLIFLRSESGPSANMLMQRTKESNSSDRSAVELKPAANGAYTIESIEINGAEYQPLR